MKDIELVYKGEIYRIPNRWDGMTARQYIRLVADLLRMAAGGLSAGEVRINWLCDIMNWDRRRFRTEEQIANLVAISEQLTFLFQINYPDNNAVLDGMDSETYELCRRVDPFRLHLPIARVLRRLDYQYVVDLCFCAQLIPSVRIKERRYRAIRWKRAMACSPVRSRHSNTSRHGNSSGRTRSLFHSWQPFSTTQRKSTIPNMPTPLPGNSLPCPRNCSRPYRLISRLLTIIFSTKPRSHCSPSSSPSLVIPSPPMPPMHSMTSPRKDSAMPGR